ncbi:hypothetical protein JZ751_019222 [Albula glossodonta]|uniref:Protein kinase domain-containing protein n=1 Tax=Albula glossodonta TaxID=121402 RepID=A0A8T2NMZ5_9TELE|nr:hypothetical protein JZ751_019222 [Albula glossodonta]
MGSEQSILQQKGYALLKEDGQIDFRKEVRVKSNKDGQEFIVKPINMKQVHKGAILKEEIETRITNLQTMQHPNIVKYKETFEDGDTLYVVMEYYKGNLSKMIDRQGKALFKEEKFKVTVNELQVKVNELKEIIAHMESVHYGSTAGSLAGGVIGAAGGITSIVGLILAPFTLGASLIVTGVGIGVAVAGGVTGAASNITNMDSREIHAMETGKH